MPDRVERPADYQKVPDSDRGDGSHNQGVPLEDVQYLLGHADPRTTRLYDHTKRQVTRNIVERISI